MAKVTITAGVNPFIIQEVSNTDGRGLFITPNTQITANKGSGSLTFQAKASGSALFEDIIDSTGATIGTIDFSAPKTLRIIGTSINALQCDASGLSEDAVIEVLSI
jgi:hypothetical protein